MTSKLLINKVRHTADELMCRLSNGKVDAVSHVGKRLFPDGYWGGSHDHDQPTLFLTFDDGPNPATTPRLLEMLEQEGMKATFFLIGYNCARYPHLVEDIKRAGHEIGNHTYNHLMLPFLPTKKIESEIDLTSQLIHDITGEAPRIFRPPFGIMDPRTGQILKERGLTPVYWGSAPEDWSNPGSHRVIRRIMWKITDGTLIVLHEGADLGIQTLEAAKEIVYRCKTLGYQFQQVILRA